MFCMPLSPSISVANAGGKAYHLARVRGLGLQVPETTVLTREVLRRFLEANALEDRIAEYVASFATGGSSELNDRHRAIGEAVRSGSFPPEVKWETFKAVDALLARAPCGLAVRSSAVYEDSKTASFAGVFESYLGATDPDKALQNVLDCWIASWSPRAIRYLSRMDIEPRVDAMAVMIQQVIPAKSSGVIYTADPNTGNPWRFVLQATHGLSIDLTSGSGASDSYTIDWDSGAIRDREVAAKPVLLEPTPEGVKRQDLARSEARKPAARDAELATVAALARQIDEAFSMRVDVEWVIAEEKTWVVQTRPMTTLPEFFPHELTAEDRSKTWERTTFVLPLRADHPPHFVTPLYRDFSESEMWYRYQPTDIVLTGIHKEERDFHGCRYRASPCAETFVDYFESPADWATRTLTGIPC